MDSIIKKYQYRCAVRGCETRKNVGDKIPLHRFPKKGGDIWINWVRACKNVDLATFDLMTISAKRFFICHRHFNGNNFYAKRNGQLLLKSGTIPTLNLPEIDENEPEVTLSIDLPKFPLESCEAHLKSINIVQSANHSPSVGKISAAEYEKPEENNLHSFRESSLHFRQEDWNVNLILQENFNILNINEDLHEVFNVNAEPAEEIPINAEEIPINVEEIPINVEENRQSELGNPPAPAVTFRPKSKVKTRPSNRLVFKNSESANFSPQKRKFFDQIHSERKEKEILKKKLKRSRERFKKLEEYKSDDRFQRLTGKLNTVQKTFIDMILKNYLKDPKQRRYTTDMKILCLSIYKRSAKCYRYLKSIIGTLPCPTTLKTALKNIEMDTGVNDSTRHRLQEFAGMCKTELEKVMFLLWDELLLSSGLHYDKIADKIVGFEDFGSTRNERVADHALVFMLRSAQNGDVLPIAFNFCDSQTKSVQLQSCIKEVVKAVKDAGLNVVATICDGASTNDSAIRAMMEDTKRMKGAEYVERHGTFIVHGMEIIPLFDPPHLLKCIRNNMLDKDLEFDSRIGKEEQERTFGNWDHLIIAYEIDTFGSGRFRAMKNLTDQHVYPHLINKMSVKTCYQATSGTSASTIQALAGGPEWQTSIGPRRVPLEGRDTAKVFALLNQLGDAYNGKIPHDPNSSYRTLLTDGSFHMDFFNEAKAKLLRMRFVDRETRKPTTRQPPSLHNLRRTIEGTQHLWKRLKDLGFQHLKTKHLNQDPLENFFGLVRDHGAQNTKPTCFQFIGHFKALVINNLTHYHTLGSNCDDDEGSFLLSWQNYLSFQDESVLDDDTGEGEILRSRRRMKHKRRRNLPTKKIVPCQNPIPEKGNVSTEIGAVMKSLKKKVPSLDSCTTCKELVTCVERPFGKRVNVRGKSMLEEIYTDVTTLLRRIMVTYYVEVGVLEMAVAFLQREARTDVVTCQIHKESLVENFLNLTVEQYIRATAAYLNRILAGKLTFPTQEAEEAEAKKNVFLARVIAKRKASLHKKHTYSTLSRTNPKPKRGRFAQQ